MFQTRVQHTVGCLSSVVQCLLWDALWLYDTNRGRSHSSDAISLLQHATRTLPVVSSWLQYPYPLPLHTEGSARFVRSRCLALRLSSQSSELQKNIHNSRKRKPQDTPCQSTRKWGNRQLFLDTTTFSSFSVKKSQLRESHPRHVVHECTLTAFS